jgi:tetratricopeptide (TPR) repeat protein
MAFLQRALSLARSVAHLIHEARVLIVLADYNWSIGEYSAAIAHTSEAQRLAHLSSNLCDEARAITLEARCRRDLGQYKECVVLLHRGRELLKLCGMSGGTLEWYLIEVEQIVHFQKSEYAAARSIAIEARDISSNQDTHHYASSLLDIAEIDVIIGSHEHVMQNLDKAQKSFSSADIQSLTFCEIVVADLKLSQGDTMTAKTILEKALARSWRKDAVCSFYCLERMADINRWKSIDFHWTSTYAVIYLAFANKSQQKLALHKALRCLGDFFVQDGVETTAKNLFIVALEGFTYMDVHRSRADCMLRLGDIAKKQKDLAKAVKLWTNARPLFEISLQAKDVAQIDARLDISEGE